MGKLTEITIKNLKVPDDVGKYSDGAGLYFELLASGRRRWVYRYRVKIKGKWSGRTMILGAYPEMKLAAARGELARQKVILKAGEDPVTKRKGDRLAKEKEREEEERRRVETFQNIAFEWLERKKESWSERTYKKSRQMLEKDVFPAIGTIPIADVTPRDILTIIHIIEERGSYEIANKTLRCIKGVFKDAVLGGKILHNPAREMQGILKTRPVVHRLALPKKELPLFLSRLPESTSHIITKAALKFVVLTGVRQGEARKALWPEIDFSSRLWDIPKGRMKAGRAHTVYLSDQAIKILQDMKQYAVSEKGLIFPGVKNPNKPLSDGTLQGTIKRMGFRGKATVHGFRSLLETSGAELMSFDKDALEKVLAHKDRDKTRDAYHRARYLEERKRIMVWWGAWLEAIEKSGEMVPEEDYIPPRVSTEG